MDKKNDTMHGLPQGGHFIDVKNLCHLSMYKWLKIDV